MRRPLNSGFTYLELLLSLALLAIMSVLIAGSMDFSRRVWEQGANLSDTSDQAIVRYELRQIVESWDRKGDAVFVGGQDRFSWQGLARVAGAAARFDVSVETEQRNGRTDLALLRALDGQAHVSQTLADQLKNIRFLYFGQIEARQERAWHETWPGPAPPKLIKIEALRANGRAWPPIVLKPGKMADQRLISSSSPLPPT